MNKNLPINRRKFVKLSTGVIATVPLLASTSGMAQELPELTEDDATGAALGYKISSATVDAATYPNHEASQLCSSCALYLGQADDASGPCSIFPGKSVAADGWCSVWAAKPA